MNSLKIALARVEVGPHPRYAEGWTLRLVLVDIVGVYYPSILCRSNGSPVYYVSKEEAEIARGQWHEAYKALIGATPEDRK